MRLIHSTAVIGGALAILLLTAAQSQEGERSQAEEDVLAHRYAEYKLGDGHGSTARAATEDWGKARQRIAANPALGRWVDTHVRRLTEWIDNYPDRAEWIAGWGHNLVDSKTKLPFRWSWTSPEPAQDSPEHAAWVYYRRSTNIGNVQEAARLFRLTGNTRLADWAVAQLDFYAENYGKWPVQSLNGHSQMMGQSLDEAVAAIALADAARLLRGHVPQGRRTKWDAGLFVPLMKNLQTSNRARDNISVWQGSAIAILALELDRPADFNQAISGPGGIREMLAKGVTEDFLWFEPSNSYAAYAQIALGHLFVAADLAGKGDALQREKLLVQDWLIGQASMRFSDGTMPAIGDTTPGQPAFNPRVLDITQRTIPIRAPRLGIGWAAIIDPPPEQALSPTTEMRSQLWKTIQVAMLRREGWELLFRYGQANQSHAQYDALSYDLRYRNTIIFEAPGVAAYGSPLFLNYLRQSLAHIMPIVDGQGQAQLGPGELIAFDDNQVAARHGDFAVGAIAERRVALTNGAMEEITRISAGQGMGSRLGEVFNTPCRVELAEAFQDASAAQGKGFNFWGKTRVAQNIQHWQTDLTCGDARFSFSLNADKPGRLYVAGAPDRSGKLARTAIYFETSAPEKVLNLGVGIKPR